MDLLPTRAFRRFELHRLQTQTHDVDSAARGVQTPRSASAPAGPGDPYRLPVCTDTVKVIFCGQMIISFGGGATEDFFHGRATKRAAKFKNFERVARRKLDMLNAAKSLTDLAGSPGNQLEALKGDLRGYHSIRVNEQWRVIFVWQEGNASFVEIRDYH